MEKVSTATIPPVRRKTFLGNKGKVLREESHGEDSRGGDTFSLPPLPPFLLSSHARNSGPLNDLIELRDNTLTVEKLPSPIALPKMKSLGVRLCVGGLMVVRAGFVVGETRGARVLGGATTPLVTSFVGGDILDTGPSTVTAGCGETVSAWFATRCNGNANDLIIPYLFILRAVYLLS